MRRTIPALLAFALILAMAAPAYAAGTQAGGPVQAGNAGVCPDPVGDQVPDRVRDQLGDGSCAECTPVQEGVAAQVQAGPREAAEAPVQARVQAQVASERPETPVQSRVTSGAPDTVVTAQTQTAQQVLAENAERVQTQSGMPDDVRERLAELFNRIMERMRAFFGEA